MEAKLIVVGGEVKASEIKLKLPTIIGRGKGATLLLQHPLVSRQHCEIYEDDGQLVVRDMGSLNGTFVNNARLTEPTYLPSGDLLTIGDVTFRAEYTSDPNLKPPSGPKTARIGGLPTSQGSKSAKEPAANAPAEDDVEDIDFGSVEVVDDEAPKVNSLDEIPAISASDAEFDPMAFLDEDEAPQPKRPTVEKTAAKSTEEKKPAASMPQIKTPEAKTPAKPAPAAPAKPVAASDKPASPAGTTKTGGAPGSRWVMPGSESNETLKAPNKPKTPVAPKTDPPQPSAEAKSPGIAPPKEVAAPAAKAKDEAADFLAALGMQEASPALADSVEDIDIVDEAFQAEEADDAAPQVEDVAIEDVAIEDVSLEEVAEIDDIGDLEVADIDATEMAVANDLVDAPSESNDPTGDFLASLGLDEAPAVTRDAAEAEQALAPAASDSVEELDFGQVEEVEEVAEASFDFTTDDEPAEPSVVPPTPVAEAVSAVTPPPSVESAPEAAPPDDTTDDVASFLAELDSAPATNNQPVAITESSEEVVDVAAIEVDEVEDFEVAEPIAVEEVAEEVGELPEPVAESSPALAPPPTAAPVVTPPTAVTPGKRPHAAPAVPFAMPYKPAKPVSTPSAPAAPPAAAAPPPARRGHAAPRGVPGPAIVPPAARPAAPAPATPPGPSAPSKDDEGLSDFLKNLGK